MVQSEHILDDLAVIVRELYSEAIFCELLRYPLRQYSLAILLFPSDQIIDVILPIPRINSRAHYGICLIRFRLVGKEVTISEFFWAIHNQKVFI